MVGIRLQDWPCIETTLGKFNLILKSSIYMRNGATVPPISASFYSGNEWISADV